ncbi:hypothetical protein GCM10010174_23610 [Kutzneria viridogrisea]|uniref:DNA-binding MarR family transcriptional regulator n=1 Tax=Kutzneria viridogrisea TaxID=47990 RepID=A0ABR6BXA9_9PSEU|nr:DNA-binding MarR family transcriptional regulator [Kutzneria viridogrisea]
MTNRDEALQAIEQSATALLQRANRAHLYGELLRAGGLDLDDAVYPVLSVVADLGSARVAEVAAAAGIGPTTGSRHLTQLERLHLVRRGIDPQDARAAVVELTPAGKRVIAKMRRARVGLFAEMVEDWSDEELSQFGAHFQRFVLALAERRR